MTHKEKIIATAYTGIMFVDGSELGEVYAYEEEKLGHGVIDIMHADKEFQQKLRNAVREDFLAMIGENEEIKEEDYIDDLALNDMADAAFKERTADMSIPILADSNFFFKEGFVMGYNRAKVIGYQHMLHLVDACEQDKQLLIDKACEWLKENIDKYLYNRGGDNEYIPTCGDKMIDEFRKAMKGE